MFKVLMRLFRRDVQPQKPPASKEQQGLSEELREEIREFRRQLDFTNRQRLAQERYAGEMLGYTRPPFQKPLHWQY